MSERLLNYIGFDCTLYAESLGRHTKMSSLTSEAIYEGGNGTQFTFGPVVRDNSRSIGYPLILQCATLYATTGGSNDYVLGPGKADWSYAFELRDKGDYGFVR